MMSQTTHIGLSLQANFDISHIFTKYVNPKSKFASQV